MRRRWWRCCVAPDESLLPHDPSVEVQAVASAHPDTELGAWLRGPAFPGTLAPTLEVLEIASCCITGALPPTLGLCVRLEVLDAGDNEINELPAELYTLTQLRHLHLHDNRLTKIDPAIRRLTRLGGEHGLLTLARNPELAVPPPEVWAASSEGIHGCFQDVARYFRPKPKSARKKG